MFFSRKKLIFEVETDRDFERIELYKKWKSCIIGVEYSSLYIAVITESMACIVFHIEKKTIHCKISIGVKLLPL
ncbi:hypothetical protein [Candidatus Uabimicrobium sp. HlEnr_7]|uniref:hypothetical protein n=1 Tax=Candidatus Uabimicrobium helgolandensis TaxID=3095367 RepID=UPI003557D1E0